MNEKYPTSSPSVLHPEVYGEKGWTYLKFSFTYYTKAIECFQQALEQQPEDSEWNAGLAIALYRKESDSQKGSKTSLNIEESLAIKQLRRALQINPADGVLLSMLAIRLAVYQNHREAKDLIETALRTDPDNPHITRYVAKYLRNQGDVDESIDLLQQALHRTSESAFIHHQLALCYKRKKITEHHGNRKAGQRWRRQCIHHLNRAVQLKPTFVLALADLGLLYGEEQNLSRANELFKQAAEAPESSKSIQQFFHVRYGDFHFYHSKQEAEAITHYTKGLLLLPHTWEQKQCAKKLQQIADRRLLTEESDGPALALLGLVAKAEGNKRKAVELYEKALDCDSNNEEYLSALLELRMELH
ncbi:interferon-induced protein with tetratricopeptide repeats 5-like [Scomber scombrus]|uniref:Interferon-induced protein with tetratricopeptide repeats 5-like n=1 Tax=Scomber scombrus TaxID=13677 RepID=A0AAV1QLZ7_SCOSC